MGGKSERDTYNEGKCKEQTGLIEGKHGGEVMERTSPRTGK
jgi:hypothetical protein